MAPWLAERAADPDALNALARERGLALPDGRPLAFSPAPAPLGALAYEKSIATHGVIPTRPGNLHDRLNALMWILFPRTKAALNALHVEEDLAGTPNARSERRDAATLLDESGLILACDDVELVALLRDRAWRALFWTRRDDVARRMRPMVIGHGLAGKLLHPFRALTAKVLVVPLEPSVLPAGDASARFDSAAAEAVAGPGFGPACLTPLPVAALPGWSDEGLGERLFDDGSVFRPRMLG